VVFLTYSVPEIITSDNGTQFKSIMFRELLTKYGIKHIRTPVYSPQSNASERVNRTLLSAIRSYLSDHDHTGWDIHLSEFTAALRNTIHDSTRFSPHYLVFGQHMTLHGSDYSLRKLLFDQDANEVQVATKPNRLNLIKDQVMHYLKVAHDTAAKRYNLRSQNRVFNPGQAVFVRSFAQSDATRKFSAKLAAKFIPAFIKSKVGNVAYVVHNSDGKLLGTYHIKDIRS